MINLDHNKIENLEDYALGLVKSMYLIMITTNCNVRAMGMGILQESEMICGQAIKEESKKLLAFYQHQLNLVGDRIPDFDNKIEQWKTKLREKL